MGEGPVEDNIVQEHPESEVKSSTEIDDHKDVSHDERADDEILMQGNEPVNSSNGEGKTKSRGKEERKSSKSKSKEESKAPKQRNRYETYYKIVPAPYVNVFEDVVPDLSSGRPVRRNKL